VAHATWERVYEHFVESQPLRAARAAFWTGLRSLVLGELGRANGWLARAQRLVDEHPGECAERGFLMIPFAFRAQRSGKDQDVHDLGMRIAALGDRFGEPDLSVFGRHLQGRALIRLGQIDPALAFLDESMVGLESGKVSPAFTGIIYCGMIAACQRIHAVARAREWTRALTGWCDRQQGLVAFAGICLVHRAELLQLGGDWPESLEEARRAAVLTKQTDPGSIGDAHYQEAEIHRLRGDVDHAEAAYALASQYGREPHPGLALLRLAQGQNDVARTAIVRVLAETKEPILRARFLPAAVEVQIACGDARAAREACGALDEIASAFGSEALVAQAARARGLVHLAEGDAVSALGPLRRAFWLWQELEAPYEAACVRVQIGRACAALGDEDGAQLERSAARAIFEELGAAPALATLEAAPVAAPTAVAKGGLTKREIEVLRLVAVGKTNKQIARDLFLSEKTIDRHLSNIFAKLDVPTRTAATTHAHEHGLI
jgi:DNA-binding CsgD family transcriptional regulator